MPASATKTWPAASVAMPVGPSNCPSPAPALPQANSSAPSSCELLHPVGEAVDDVDVAERVDGDVPRSAELAGTGAGRPPRRDERAAGREALHAVALRIDDVDAAARVDGDTLRREELPLARSGRPPRADMVALGGEPLNTGARGIGDVDRAERVGGDLPRPCELARAAARRAKGSEQRPGGREPLHAAGSSVGDVHDVAAARDARRRRELPCSEAGRAPRRDDTVVGARGRTHAKRVCDREQRRVGDRRQPRSTRAQLGGCAHQRRARWLRFATRQRERLPARSRTRT